MSWTRTMPSGVKVTFMDASWNSPPMNASSKRPSVMSMVPLTRAVRVRGSSCAVTSASMRASSSVSTLLTYGSNIAARKRLALSLQSNLGRIECRQDRRAPLRTRVGVHVDETVDLVEAQVCVHRAVGQRPAKLPEDVGDVAHFQIVQGDVQLRLRVGEVVQRSFSARHTAYLMPSEHGQRLERKALEARMRGPCPCRGIPGEQIGGLYIDRQRGIDHRVVPTLPLSFASTCEPS